MSNTTYSWVTSAFMISYMIMFSVGGWLLDVIGMRRGMMLSMLIWSAASVAHGFVGSALGLAVARMFLGLGEGACTPAVAKGACEWFPPEKRALSLGIANSGSAFGSVLAPPLTAWLAVEFGWRGAFYATGILGMMWLVGWLATTRSVSAVSKECPLTDTPSVRRCELLRDPRVWRVLAARFFFDPFFYFFMFWIPQYLSRERGFSLQQIGSSYWIPFLALGLSTVFGGYISDILVRRGWSSRKARSVFLCGAAVVMPFSGVVTIMPTADWAIALMACLMIAHGFWICNFLAFVGDQFPSSVIGTVVGLSGTVGALGGTIANLIIGPVVDHWSFTPVFAVSAVLYPLAAVILLAKRNHSN